MVKVSVIVPIYNVEQYLEKCLDSLVNQTLKEIEIILVNDASPDHSDVIMEKYEKKYDTIKTIYLKENRSLGGARNAGMEIASGKYITFVDSDDWLDLDYLEKMYNACEETGSDVAYSAYKHMDESGTEIRNNLFTWPIEFSGTLTKAKINGIILKAPMVWGKLYSFALWKSIGITFPEHIKYEDSPTLPIYMLHAKSCCYVADTYYRYLVRDTSITGSRNSAVHRDEQKTALLLVERMKHYGFYEEYQEELELFVVKQYYSTFLRRCLQKYDEIPYEWMKQARDDIRKWYPNFESNPYYHTLLLEDRLRMQMNEFSPYTCAIWEQNFKEKMAQDEQFYPSVYLEFYESRKDIIDRIIAGKKRIGLYGDKHKKKALKQFLDKYYSVEIIDFESMKDIEHADLTRVDIIAGVNPSASTALYQTLTSMNCHTQAVNFEDILHGYIEEV